MITPAQCRAARGLLNWSQQALADAAQVGVVTVQKFETGTVQARNATLAVIVRAFESEGIEFLFGDAPGLRLHSRPARRKAK